MKRYVAILVFVISSFSYSSFAYSSLAYAAAADLSEVAHAEIHYLFQQLENSGCQFNRNGSWYTSADAADHLRKKYDHLLKKNMLTTTESFIKKAASESSMSGKPYQVKCENMTAMASSAWFNERLNQYRKSKL